MRTSERRPTRALIVEAAVASAVALVAALLMAPRGLGIGTLVPHPAWLAVVVLAARYGGRGLAVGLPISWGTLMLASTVAGAGVGPLAVLSRLSAGPELGAFVAVALVSWMASMHERRHAQAAARLEALQKRCAAEHEALKALQSTAVALRARADRLHTSLTFLRDVSERLSGGDAEAASQAALDLAMARLGARAAVLRLADGGGVRPLATAGIWSPGATRGGAPDASGAAGVDDDRTAEAALRTGRPMRAVDLPEGGPHDSDLAAPIFDSQGQLLGVLAVRGVPEGGAGAPALRELAVIAGWCAGALSRSCVAREGVAQVAAAAMEPAAADEDSPQRSISQANA